MTPQVHALPEDTAWAAPLADPRSPLSAIVVRPGAIDATLAQTFRVVGVDVGAWRLRTGLAASLFCGFEADGELTFDFETFDGWFAVPVDVASGPWSARLEVAHVSAHYGDGVRDDAVRPGNFDPWSREYVRLQAARTIGPARVQAGARMIVHAVPEAPPFGVSLGGEVEGPWKLAPYAAFDLELAEEDGWAPLLAGQAGARWTLGQHRLRLAAAARSGPEDAGKRRPATEQWIGVLFGFDPAGSY